MEVVLGKRAGFCPGVKNTVIKTEKILEQVKEIYCLGQLVHNKQVTEKLKQKGLKIVDDISVVPNNSYLIIRAHGIPKETYKKIKEKNIKALDLTCPKVLQIHKQVENYAKLGYYIILTGEKEHPEVIGTYSFGVPNISVVENLEDIKLAVECINKKDIRNIAVVSQTTFSMEKFEQYTSNLKKMIKKDSNLEINKTICDATKLRQMETTEIARQVELMVIIGGKNSSNTKKLYEISLRECNNAVLVETIDDLYMNYVKRFKKIGIMAGASTPKYVIDEIVQIIENTKTENYMFGG